MLMSPGNKKNRLRQQTVHGCGKAAKGEKMNMNIIPPEDNRSQVDILLDYLQKYGSITGLECIQKLGILNYKGRISDLRKLGYNIETVWEIRENIYGETKRYARYYYRG